MSTMSEALRKKEKPFREKTIVVDEDHIYGAPLIRRALVEYLIRIQNEHHILRICQERDLTAIERDQLPVHMRKNSREELAGQVDSWGSLRIRIEDWIEEFTFDQDSNKPPRERRLSKLS